MNRQYSRKPLVLYLDVLEQTSQELLGHLGDISEHGMMFISQRVFSIGQRLIIAIRLPNNDDFAQSMIQAQVEVRWTQPNLNPRLTCIGCQFLQLNPTDLPLIKKIGDFIGFDASVDVQRVAHDQPNEKN